MGWLGVREGSEKAKEERIYPPRGVGCPAAARTENGEKVSLTRA